MTSGEHVRVWERVTVFISSTFNDMHAERDYLVKNVFPRMQEWCERRKLRFVDVDLRWGVTEADATQGRNVVQVCLDRIDDCRPFFLCFQGQRYGWVPLKSDIAESTFDNFPGLADSVSQQSSITEFEVNHAVVHPYHKTSESPHHPLAEHTFFYYRDPDYLQRLPKSPPERLCIYSDEFQQDPMYREFLKAKRCLLQEVKIRATGKPIRRYRARWSDEASTPEMAIPLECPATLPENIDRWRQRWLDVADVRVSGFKVPKNNEARAKEYNALLTAGRLVGFFCDDRSLGDVILDDLTAAISARFPDRCEITAESEVQREVDLHDEFVYASSEIFIERQSDFDELDRYACDDSRCICVVVAPGGVGKSTLLANWVAHLHQRASEATDEPSASVHCRFIGVGERSAEVTSLLRFLLLEMQQAGAFTESIPVDPEKLRGAWPRLLAASAQARPVVLVIDGLNQLESGISDLDWLPDPLPRNVRIIVSFKTGEAEADALVHRLGADPRFHVIPVRPFEELEDRRRLVRTFLSQYLKGLDASHLEALIRIEGAENPLFLRVVLSELRIFGAFDKLAEQVRGAFGTNAVDAFDAVLRRLEGDSAYTTVDLPRVVALLFGYLANSRHGLSVTELTRLLEIDEELSATDVEAVTDGIYLILRQLRPFLSFHDGRHTFFYQSFEIAAQQRYGTTGPDDAPLRRPAEDWHRRLARFFRAQAGGDEVSPWTVAIPRSLMQLPYYLLRANEYHAFSALYLDLGYLDAMCRTGAAVGEEGKQSYSGIFDLITNLREAKDYLLGLGDELSETGQSLVERLDATVQLLAERSALLHVTPRVVRQEVSNYLHTGEYTNLATAFAGVSANIPSRFAIAKKSGGNAAEPGHSAAVTSLSAVGDVLLSGAKDGTVACWKRGEEKPVWIVGVHKAKVTCVSLSADAKRAISVGEAGDVMLWDVPLANPIELDLNTSDLWTYAHFGDFLADGSLLLIWGSEGVRINVRTRAEYWRVREIGWSLGFHDDDRVAFSATSDLLITPDDARKARVFEASTGRLLRTMDTSGLFQGAAVSSDGRIFFTSDRQGRVAAYDTTRGLLMYEKRVRPLYTICRAADGPVFFGCDIDQKISRILVDNGLHIETQESASLDTLIDDPPSRIIALPDRETLALGLDSGAILLIDWERGEVVQRRQAGGGLCIGSILPGGTEAVGVRGPITKGDARRGKRVMHLAANRLPEEDTEMHHRRDITCAATLDTERVVTVDKGGRAVVWRRGKQEQIFDMENTDITTCTCWSDTGLAVCGTQSNEVLVLGRGGGYQRQFFTNNHYEWRSGIAAIAVAGKPRRTIAGYFNGDIRYSIIGARGDKTWISNKQEALRVTAVALSGNEVLAASGNKNGHVYLWDCADGEQLHRWKLHQGEVVALAFAPGDDLLFTVGIDRMLYGIAPDNGEIVEVTMLPHIPVTFLVEPNGAINALDAAGTIFRFGVNNEANQGKPKGMKRLLRKLLWRAT